MSWTIEVRVKLSGQRRWLAGAFPTITEAFRRFHSLPETDRSHFIYCQSSPHDLSIRWNPEDYPMIVVSFGGDESSRSHADKTKRDVVDAIREAGGNPDDFEIICEWAELGDLVA